MILVDGPNFVWRGFYASRGLQSNGRDTSVLHIGFSMLATMKDLFEPGRIIFLWDSRNSWRKKIFPEYKANRTGKSEERKAVYPQIEVFRKVLTAIGILSLEAEGLEADDLIGIFTTALARRGKSVTIVSSDKDLFQLLLSSNTVQVRGWKGRRLDRWDGERVQKEYHVPAFHWAAYLALVGDKVDNIPSVRRGMGPVTGAKLLRTTGVKCLSEIEYNTWQRNLSITRVKTSWDDCGLLLEDLKRPPRSESSWAQLEEVLTEYELFQLWGDRGRLWEVGGW